MLSEGWGGGRGVNLNIGNPDFVASCTSYYKLATTRVPSNLTRIRDLKRGDLLVSPHLPGDGEVSIHVVADDYPACYEYVLDDDTHQNHRIAIQRSYGLDGEVSIQNLSLAEWYGKLQWLRLPLIPIPQHESAFRGIVDMLDKCPGTTFGASKLGEYLDQLRAEVMVQLKSELQKIRPSGTEISFEAICERLVVAAGYQVVARNQYDREGGDVDLRCVRDRADASPFEAGQTTLFVQVKKHTGETDHLSANQLLAMIAREPSADGCVMSLGDRFSEGAKDLAQKNGVLLMTGDVVCRLLVRTACAAGRRLGLRLERTAAGLCNRGFGPSLR
jgi:hypothetical protein